MLNKRNSLKDGLLKHSTQNQTGKTLSKISKMDSQLKRKILKRVNKNHLHTVEVKK